MRKHCTSKEEWDRKEGIVFWELKIKVLKMLEWWKSDKEKLKSEKDDILTSEERPKKYKKKGIDREGGIVS